MTIRFARLRRRTAWTFLIAATLAFKSFVPLLAAASAQMQGKAVADVCSVYGVRLAAAAEAGHLGSHPMAHPAGMHVPMGGDDPGSHDGETDPSAHAKDHCALTGLAACAVLGLESWAPADWAGVGEAHAAPDDAHAPPRDASARWLTLRLHAPPSMA